MSYRITAEELAELQKRVLVLADRVRAACLEKIATFCGAEAMRQDLPVPPTLSEPILQDLPAPPTDPQEFGKWAQSLSELAEQRAELRWQEGRNEGRLEGIQVGKEEGLRDGRADALLTILRARGVGIPAELEQRIRGSVDGELLARWLVRAATATRVSDLDEERAAQAGKE